MKNKATIFVVADHASNTRTYKAPEESKKPKPSMGVWQIDASICVLHFSPFWPDVKGQVERHHRLVENALKASTPKGAA
jgi:hypothetical protein